MAFLVSYVLCVSLSLAFLCSWFGKRLDASRIGLPVHNLPRGVLCVTAFCFFFTGCSFFFQALGVVIHFFIYISRVCSMIFTFQEFVSQVPSLARFCLFCLCSPRSMMQQRKNANKKAAVSQQRRDNSSSTDASRTPQPGGSPRRGIFAPLAGTRSSRQASE